uniref:TFIID subunit TAF5 NTD2 domain-containing protein n=1 Tax=Chromera velia CCMP2878 TaxID=1169474 RepID=A0A0G4FXF2_9ALVE|eukprot:Cvel_19215.t1-p1 / transcript=Cvel_19215.t1 / gene=Cvel_19215 / organism=Chromera_velia_CCMP2878 / gene_product=Transcription initiation factor TFIID subunit 5, putative / transcript_product=Transcription initiation factor TFIID subunit 5, putative / location=Cvel_scaffold1641:12629-18883(+) / protein_length=820 / sequence_SO=supercontig / SO=protein_coding / is_pseudo=false
MDVDAGEVGDGDRDRQSSFSADPSADLEKLYEILQKYNVSEDVRSKLEEELKDGSSAGSKKRQGSTLPPPLSPVKYAEMYRAFVAWCDESLEDSQQELLEVRFPIFIYIFADLVVRDMRKEALFFLTEFGVEFESAVPYAHEMRSLRMVGTGTMQLEKSAATAWLLRGLRKTVRISYLTHRALVSHATFDLASRGVLMAILQTTVKFEISSPEAEKEKGANRKERQKHIRGRLAPLLGGAMGGGSLSVGGEQSVSSADKETLLQVNNALLRLGLPEKGSDVVGADGAAVSHDSWAWGQRADDRPHGEECLPRASSHVTVQDTGGFKGVSGSSSSSSSSSSGNPLSDLEMRGVGREMRDANRVRVREISGSDIKKNLFVSHVSFANSAGLSACAVSRTDGRLVAGAFSDLGVKIWSLEAMEKQRELIRADRREREEVADDGFKDLQTQIEGVLEEVPFQSSVLGHPEGYKDWVPYKRAFGHQGPVFAMDFSSDSQFLLTGGLDGKVKMFNVLADALTIEEEEEEGYAEGMDPNQMSDLERMEAKDRDEARGIRGGVRCTRAKRSLDEPIRCPCMHTFQGHSGPIWDISWDPSGDDFFFLTAGADRTARLYCESRPDAVRVFGTGTHRHRADVTSIRVHPNRSLVSTSSDDGTIRMWDVRQAKCVRLLQWHLSPVRSLAFSPSGRALASGSLNGDLIFWDLQRAMPVSIQTRAHSGLVSSMTFAPHLVVEKHFSLLASCGYDSVFQLRKCYEGGMGDARETEGKRRHAGEKGMRMEVKTKVKSRALVKTVWTDSGVLFTAGPQMDDKHDVREEEGRKDKTKG